MPNWFLAKTQKQLSARKIAFPISGSGKTGHPFCCCIVIQLCLNLCNPIDCNTTGFLVLHHLQEFAQTHVHCVSGAIQPSYPVSSTFLLPFIFPSIRVFSIKSALCIRRPKYWSFSFNISSSNEYNWFLLGLTGLIALKFKGLSRVLSSSTVQKHHFFSTQPSLWSNAHIHIWLLGKL